MTMLDTPECATPPLMALESLMEQEHQQPDTDSDAAKNGFLVNNKGVFYYNDNGDPVRICSKLEISALVRDDHSSNWGRYLTFDDADHHPHAWAMPAELLKGNGDEVRGELMRLGLDIATGPKAKNKLLEYIASASPNARARCVTLTGWHGQVFVLPDRTIGDAGELVLYQTDAVTSNYSTAGTLEDWQASVAALSQGNSRMVLALSTAFAAMLLEHTGVESGGVHLVGNSSTGKTTALRAAASVYGPPEYLNRWRATSNGLESLAALHNHTLLILDELAQVDPREAGEIAYMLANGSGKTRSTRTGQAAARKHWNLLFLSAGEIGLAQHMREGGKKVRAGQEIRLVDLPADAGASLGLFNTLHGFTTGAELSKAIVDGAARCYGTGALAFLEALTVPGTLEQLPAIIKTLVGEFISENLPPDASGQAHRVCERFALVAVAGELATTFAITGWPTGEAQQAAAACFRAWLEQRGGAGNQERAEILNSVRAFFETHGESRFSDMDNPTQRDVINRAGFRRTDNDTLEYLVLPGAYTRDICAHHEAKSVTAVLLAAGWLKPGSDGKPQSSLRLPGMGRARCYVFTSTMWST